MPHRPAPRPSRVRQPVPVARVAGFQNWRPPGGADLDSGTCRVGQPAVGPAQNIRAGGSSRVCFTGVRPHDVVVVGGCGHVGLPLAIAFASRGLRRRRSTTSTPSAVDAGQRAASCRSARTAPQPVLQTALADGPPARHHRPGDHRARRRRRRGRSARPVDEHLNPDPHAVPQALRELRRRTSATASCSCCAAPSTPASPRDVEQMLRRARPRRRRRLLPRADRRGQGDGRSSSRCRRSSPAARSGSRDRAAALFGSLTDDDRRARARGGRAGQAVHQHLALHQVRGGQPVLHDGQRPRPRLRADPRRRSRTTTRARPTCRAPASPPGRACSRTRCSWRRSPTTPSCSATPRCWSTRACRSTSSPSSRSSYDLADADASASSGMAFKGESDDIRSSLSYKLKRILEFRAGEVLCTDPYVTVDDSPACRSRRCSTQADLLDHRRPAPGLPRPRRPTQPVVDVWNLLGQGHDAYDAWPSPSSSRPTTRATAIVAGPGPDLRRRRVRRARSSSSSTSPRTPPCRSLAAYAERRAAAATAGQHLRPRAGQRHPLRHRPRQPRRSSW